MRKSAARQGTSASDIRYTNATDVATVTDKIGNGVGPASAHQWRYAYDGSTRHITTVTDPDGRVRATNTYDGQGRVSQQRDGVGGLTTMAYGAGQTVVTDRRGHATTYTLDDRLRVLTQSDVVGASTYTLGYTYDAAGDRTSVTDRAGDRTDFTYDSRGNVVTRSDPMVGGSGPTTSFTYDAKNNLTRIVDPLGFETTMTYDATCCSPSRDRSMRRHSRRRSTSTPTRRIRGCRRG